MFQKILVAIDSSAYSREALPTAIEVAQKFGGHLLVVHVAEHDRGRTVAYSVESPAAATRLVGEAVKKARDAGVQAKGELLHRVAGHVAPAIAATAAANSIDLIVMGSRGLSDVQSFMLGSVTHKVIQLVEVPVLVARTPRGTRPLMAAGAVGPGVAGS
jgi:nucleotide-binding universal stress UspA family protein